MDKVSLDPDNPDNPDNWKLNCWFIWSQMRIIIIKTPKWNPDNPDNPDNGAWNPHFLH
jgi:hypothetical protein